MDELIKRLNDLLLELEQDLTDHKELRYRTHDLKLRLPGEVTGARYALGIIKLALDDYSEWADHLYDGRGKDGEVESGFRR